MRRAVCAKSRHARVNLPWPYVLTQAQLQMCMSIWTCASQCLSIAHSCAYPCRHRQPRTRANIVNGYMYRHRRWHTCVGIAHSIPVPTLLTVHPYPHCRWYARVGIADGITVSVSPTVYLDMSTHNTVVHDVYTRNIPWHNMSVHNMVMSDMYVCSTTMHSEVMRNMSMHNIPMHNVRIHHA